MDCYFRVIMECVIRTLSMSTRQSPSVGRSFWHTWDSLRKSVVVTTLPPKGRFTIWEPSRGIWNRIWWIVGMDEVGNSISCQQCRWFLSMHFSGSFPYVDTLIVCVPCNMRYSNPFSAGLLIINPHGHLEGACYWGGWAGLRPGAPSHLTESASRSQMLGTELQTCLALRSHARSYLSVPLF